MLRLLPWRREMVFSFLIFLSPGDGDEVAGPAQEDHLRRVERQEVSVPVQTQGRPPTRLPTRRLQQPAQQALRRRPRVQEARLAHQDLRKQDPDCWVSIPEGPGSYLIGNLILL